MRILVFSDSHGNISSCTTVVENIINVDMILHAGDHASDAAWIQKCFPDIPVKYVRGNCDSDMAPLSLVVEAEGKKIFLTHGHCYSVKSQPECQDLIEAAKDCDCVVFGHTHEPVCFKSGELTVLNPGSAKSLHSYGVIEIEEGILRAAVCYSNPI